jgi:hypothetical protein
MLGTDGGDRRLYEGGPRRQPVDEDAKAHLQRAFRTLGDRTLIISGEGITFLDEAELHDLASFIRPWIDQTEIVAYVRSPAAFMTSMVLQRMALQRKSGKRDLFDIQLDYPYYRRRFEKFDKVLGRDNVRLWKFDPGSFPSSCVVQDFWAKLGVNFPASRVVRVNESVSRETVALLYTFRKLVGGTRTPSRARVRRQISALKDVGATKFRFSPELLRPVLEQHRADIEWMEARLGASLDEKLGEHEPGDVHDEGDLLRPDPAVVARLRALLGDNAPAAVKGETPEEVALLVGALLREHARDERPRAFRRTKHPGASDHSARKRRLRWRRLGKANT